MKMVSRIFFHCNCCIHMFNFSTYHKFILYQHNLLFLKNIFFFSNKKILIYDQIKNISSFFNILIIHYWMNKAATECLEQTEPAEQLHLHINFSTSFFINSITSNFCRFLNESLDFWHKNIRWTDLFVSLGSIY